MVPVHQEKYVEELLTPVLLFDCTLTDGQVERWSTHSATWQNTVYSPRVVGNSGFRIGLLADDGSDWGNRMTVTLANTDGYVTSLHRTENLKGCALLVSFAFLDPESGQIVSTPEAVFAGIGDAPEELTTSVGQINFTSRFSIQRLALPPTRIQEACPWSFPRNAAERAEAVSGGASGTYSRFYPCGYSPDQAGGCGNVDGNPIGLRRTWHVAAGRPRAGDSEIRRIPVPAINLAGAKLWLIAEVLVASGGRKSQDQ